MLEHIKDVGKVVFRIHEEDTKRKLDDHDGKEVEV